MKVFVISLKRSTERRARIQTLLDSAGIEFEFFDAVDGSVENFKNLDRQRPEKTKKRLGYALTRNEVACYSSHFSMWEKCVEINESILVLEDNCALTEELPIHLKGFQALANKYKFIKLFAFFKRRMEKNESISKNLDIVSYVKKGSGAQGYILTPDVAKKFITNASEFIEAVDDYMEKPWRHGVKTYYFSPDLVTRANISSTIGSDRKNKQGLTIKNKLTIEIFRLYEQIRYKLHR